MRVAVAIFALIHLTNSIWFSRRRRAPQPVPVDCVLSGWETIQACSKPCGPEGVEIQERRIVMEGRNGGATCDQYTLTQTVTCNRMCYNEGFLENGKCNCPAQWTGECCDQDVNECVDEPCAEICVNEVGSFRCECPENYTLDTDDVNCVDLQECQKTPPPCEHRCKELAGGYECYCDDGYTLADDAKSCEDVDECKLGSICEYQCQNIPGDYECICKDGYFRNPDNKTCTDIDECARLNGGCKQECENTNGGYRCSCSNGYKLAENNIDCVDVDECKELGNSLCEQLCVNILGSYDCQCIPPYTLNADQRTCTFNGTSNETESDAVQPLIPCASANSKECEAAAEEAEEQRGSDFDKDTMYNWIVGVLIIVCLVLLGLLGVMCVRKGYHRLYPPKPPPISTIPRFNNRIFNPDPGDLRSESGSGIYEDPEELYNLAGDSATSPDYMDMSDDPLSKKEEPTYHDPLPAENPYETRPGNAKLQDAEYAPHDPSSPIVGYSGRVQEGGFEHEDDYVNTPPVYDNI